MTPIWSVAASWILRICFAIRGVGLGYKYLWHEFEGDSSIFSMLLFDWELAEPLAQWIDDSCVWMMVAAAIVLLLSGCLRMRRLPARFLQWLYRLECTALTLAVLYEILLPVTKALRGGELLSEWSLAESALRVSIPLALLLIVTRPHRLQPTEWCLRIATALTFTIHGYKAWVVAPEFVTMIIATCQNIADFWPAQPSVELILKGIAVIDVIVAGLVLTRRWPRVALYASIWGLITAAARTTSSPVGWPDTLLRVAHVGGPLILYLQWRRTRKEDSPQSDSE